MKSFPKTTAATLLFALVVIAEPALAGRVLFIGASRFNTGSATRDHLHPSGLTGRQAIASAIAEALP